MTPAAPPVVPARVQQAIVRRHPRLDVLPARLPSGYRYASWTDSRSGFEIFFTNPGRAPNDLGFQALRVPCASYGRPQRTYDVNGVRVDWSGTREDKQAWRCLKGFVISASRSGAGAALDLVRLVAFARAG